LWLAACALPAFAHPFHGGAGSFAAGFVHPFAGLDHLLAMLAVGVWAMQQGGNAIWRVPLAFCAAMCVGAALGYAGFAALFIEPLIAASVFALGLLILNKQRVALAYAILLVAFFALFHGMSHAIEQTSDATPWISLMGLLAATMILHLAGMGTVALFRARVRMAGVPLIVTGVWLLSRALA
jgi:urease accessory protein